MSKASLTFLWCIAALNLSLLLPSSGTAYISTITSEGVYRFETAEAWDQFYSSGCSYPEDRCQLITENGGQVFTTDHSVGLEIFIQDAQDGENIVWRFWRPDGMLKWAIGITYDRDTDCWSVGGSLVPDCGDPNAPYLDSRVYWIANALINCEMTGVWTIEIVSNGVVRFSEPFELVQGQNSPLVILSPTDHQDFDLDAETHFTATEPITFAAQVTPPAPVDWEVELEYKPSRPASITYSDPPRTFTTHPGETHDETFDSVGGQLKITATATIGGQTVRACHTATITGAQIPEADITASLVDLYSRGATPRLMTGIAVRESNYLHFCRPDNNCTTGQRVIYNRNDEWPHESKDETTSHIGLMQVDTTMTTAWDWQTNAKQAVSLFAGDKLRFARNNERHIRYGDGKAKIPGHRGLRALTDVELENMALVLYGPYAPGTLEVPAPTLAEKLAKQYYIPECLLGAVVLENQDLECQGGLWVWMPNLTGNPQGVEYADNVRANTK